MGNSELIYDLLLNGVLVAVLVPVLSEYMDGEPHAFSPLVSSLINLVLVALGLLVALHWRFALVEIFTQKLEPVSKTPHSYSHKNP